MTDTPPEFAEDVHKCWSGPILTSMGVRDAV